MRTANKRKKNSRQRGSVTYGWGSMKKRRGAGNRGGRGNAGSGKRGDARKPYFRVVQKRELGKYGFNNAKASIVYNSANIYYIENSFETLLAKGFIKEVNKTYAIDLGKLGFNKLLGTGKPSRKYSINVDYASKSAIEKISKAGGSVTVNKADEISSEEVVEETSSEDKK